ncbi:TPA: hypothetical protein K8054_000237 [Staphylococcus pseudintermedius]|uniref:hypothetical protein n=1 Tax=Staphylococcus pseudintermedius TaxID=283734 RepID=UPI0014422010|nr:hypothetical protein [Staphylococcus pseudintermedius]EGQ2829493.1 hypothetical protein [Staphylococcus pseudintermedius]EGQ2850740.1 hypothetical protein [Staphylococcus pseudintermedius]EGQ3094347.1 hypothetical protein [Staphylococcus pseudintermedius]EGQ3156007.1 hypothetical protein [Staphylococcus pseudintermedius]EGQ3487590.1 hypothetical protein [Staphylococcus pseudintermedius]
MEKSKIYEYLKEFSNSDTNKGDVMGRSSQFKADLYFLGMEGYLFVKYKVGKDMQPQPVSCEVTDKGMKFLEEYKS